MTRSLTRIVHWTTTALVLIISMELSSNFVECHQFTETSIKPAPSTDSKPDAWSFSGPECYATSSSLGNLRWFNFTFSLRTFHAFGILLLEKNESNGDFVKLQLVNGSLHFEFDAGGGIHRLQSTSSRLDDNRWHVVRIGRQKESPGLVEIQTDAQRDSMVMDTRYITFNLDDTLYIGGLPSNVPSHSNNEIAPESGFQWKFEPTRTASSITQGCLANLSISIGSKSPRRVKFSSKCTSRVNANACSVMRTIIAPECSLDSKCSNDGECWQNGTGAFCKCTFTTFIGRECSQIGTTYKFDSDQNGKQSGITFHLNNKGQHRQQTSHKLYRFGLAFQIVRSAVIGQSNHNLLCVNTKAMEDQLCQLDLFINNNGLLHFSYMARKFVIKGNYNLADDSLHRIRGSISIRLILLELDRRIVVNASNHDRRIDHTISVIRLGNRQRSGKWRRMPFQGWITGAYFDAIRLLELCRDNGVGGINCFLEHNVQHDPGFVPTSTHSFTVSTSLDRRDTFMQADVINDFNVNFTNHHHRSSNKAVELDSTSMTGNQRLFGDNLASKATRIGNQERSYGRKNHDKNNNQITTSHIDVLLIVILSTAGFSVVTALIIVTYKCLPNVQLR